MLSKIYKNTIVATIVVSASFSVTLNLLAAKEAKHRVAVLSKEKADPNYPLNERGDILSNAGLPQLKTLDVLERLTYSYMLKKWYPNIYSSQLVHNVPFLFEDFTDIDQDNTQMVVKSRMCVAVGQVPERLYLNKVYEKGSIPEQDILNIQTHSDFPFPSTHAGLVSAQYFYGYPDDRGSSILTLKSKADSTVPIRTFLGVKAEHEPVVETLCLHPERNEAAFGGKAAEMLQYAVAAKRAMQSKDEIAPFQGVPVSSVELSNMGVGIELAVTDRNSTQAAYAKLLKYFNQAGLASNAQAHAMLANGGEVLWDSIFSGYAIGSSKALLLTGGYDPLTERYSLQVVLQDVQASPFR